MSRSEGDRSEGDYERFATGRRRLHRSSQARREHLKLQRLRRRSLAMAERNRVGKE